MKENSDGLNWKKKDKKNEQLQEWGSKLDKKTNAIKYWGKN